MPQSLSVVYCHLVFSTKDRTPWLTDADLRGCLHAYMGECSKRLDCPPVRVGGLADHVHILALLGRTITQSDWIKELKRTSHLWLEDQTSPLREFRWQSGYAIFSVSPSNRDKVESYIIHQETNHRKRSYQDEMRGLLRKHGMEWDERYVWD